MPKHCCVRLCQSNERKKSRVSYHELPAHPERRKEWIRRISRARDKTGPDWVPSDRSIVCSLHFADSDFKEGKRKRLLPTALPSQLMGCPYPQPDSEVKRRERAANGPLEPRNFSREEADPANHCPEGEPREHPRKEADPANHCPDSEPREHPRKEADPAKDRIRLNHHFPKSEAGEDANEQDEGSEVHQAFVCDVRVKTEPLSADQADVSCKTEETDQVAVSEACETPAGDSPVHKGVEKQCQTVFDFVQYKSEVNKTIKRLKMQVMRLQRKFAKAHQEKSEVCSQLEQYECDALVQATLRLREESGENVAASFLKHQLLYFDKERVRYSEDILRECAEWRACSSEGYEHVRTRSLLKLPCNLTLAEYLKSSVCKPDFGDPVTQNLEEPK